MTALKRLQKNMGGNKMEKAWLQNLRKIEPYTPGEQSKVKNKIKLNANENPYPPSPKVLEAIKNFDCSNLRFYPNANATQLKEALAQYYNVSQKQIFVGNGSDEVIALSFLAFFNSKKPILFPDITYSFYPVWCSLFCVPYETIPLDEQFQIYAKDYYKENGGVILPNPNAPTGIGQTKELIEDILQHNQDCIVSIDEAYVDFGAYSCIELLEKYENLVITQTFSKSRSLAGMRIGTAIANETLIQTLEAVKNSYNSYTLDSLAIECGIASVKDDVYFKKTIQKVIHTRKWTAKELEKLGFEVYPSQSNFLFTTHSKISAKELFEKLKEKNIFIRYFNLPRIDNHLRITIGTEEEMKILIEQIKFIL